MRLKLSALAVGLLLVAAMADVEKKPPKYLRLKFRRVEPTVPEDVLQRAMDKLEPTCNSSAPCHTEVSSRGIQAGSNLYSNGGSFVDINLGTPPQRIRVLFDTGSPQVWVARANACQDDGYPLGICRGQLFQDALSNSTTVTSDFMGLQYGGGFVKGVFADEGNMVLGNPKCKSHAQMDTRFRFGLGMEHKGIKHQGGRLGMAYPHPPVNGKYILGDSLFQRLVNAGMPPKFSTFAQSCEPPTMGNRCNNGGWVTYGKHDVDHCGKEITTVKIKAAPNGDLPIQYLFDAEGLSLDVAGGKSENKFANSKFETITNSAPSAIVVSQEIWRSFMALLPSTCTEEGTLKLCPCDLQLTLNLKINSATIKIPSKNLLLKAADKNGLCEVLIKPGDKFILGDPFFRSVCHHHFWNEKTITFAEPK